MTDIIRLIADSDAMRKTTLRPMEREDCSFQLINELAEVGSAIIPIDELEEMKRWEARAHTAWKTMDVWGMKNLKKNLRDLEASKKGKNDNR